MPKCEPWVTKNKTTKERPKRGRYHAKGPFQVVLTLTLDAESLGLTRRVERGEMGGNFSKRVPPACAAGQGFLDLLFLLQAGTLPGLLADSCVQKAAGGDGPVAEDSAAVGIQGEK